MSLPSWERGLKSACDVAFTVSSAVAPLVGAWIEIRSNRLAMIGNSVAPLVGAWIEITGQKSYIRTDSVAPLVGAWIEISNVM